ncbi:hypothetical protein [Sedimentibacter sp. B4]|uniref:hypothetical protein n=1 Tax=Sedimentibacter sp. B4 TaxID=304766 RepID=UPI0002ED7EB6|nr:hypothetical protein [Sedimentibacter sp. B4]
MGERFLGKLAYVTDPETKRKIIGNEFIRVYFYGTVVNPNNNQPWGAAGAMFQLLEDDSFELIEAYFGDEKLVGDDINEFLEIIYNN